MPPTPAPPGAESPADPHRPTTQRRVLLIAGTLRTGGAERQTLNMVRVLVGRGHTVMVIGLESGGSLEPSFRDAGAQVVVLDRRENSFARRLLAVITTARRFQPDIIQAAHNWVNAYALVVGAVLRRPSIGALRNQPESVIKGLGALGRFALFMPRIVAANTGRAVEAMQRLGMPADRLSHLPNAVDLDFFGARPEHDTSGPTRLLSLGRLDPQKRVDRFVELVARLRDRDADVTATIVGPGATRDELEALARRHGLTPPHLTFHDGGDPRRHYHDADVFVFTADPGDGMPNVVLEAMASELAVVAFAEGGVREVIDDGHSGIIIEPPGDIDALVDGVAKLVGDNARIRRLGANAREAITTKHSAEALGDALEELHARRIQLPTGPVVTIKHLMDSLRLIRSIEHP